MKSKRKIYLIKKGFQLKIIIRMFMTIGIIVAGMSVVQYYVHRKAVGVAHQTIKSLLIKYETPTFHTLSKPKEELASRGEFIREAVEMAQKTNQTLDSLSVSLVRSLVVILLIAFGLTGILFLFISHRIAGPIYHLERVMGQMGRGDLSIRIHLRDKDEFKDTADHFNTMAEKLEDKIAEIKNLSQSLNADKDKKRQSKTRKPGGQTFVKKLARELNYFRISDI